MKLCLKISVLILFVAFSACKKDELVDNNVPVATVLPDDGYTNARKALPVKDANINGNNNGDDEKD